MREYKRYWLALVAVLVVCFSILGYYGVEVYRNSPPVVNFTDENGKVVIDKESIYKGQEAWQSIGGMQVGSVWGHGAYQAPDWSADWLHKELVAFLEIKADEIYHLKYADLNDEQKANLKVLLKKEYRENSVKDDKFVLSADRLKAVSQVASEYAALFGNDPKFKP